MRRPAPDVSDSPIEKVELVNGEVIYVSEPRFTNFLNGKNFSGYIVEANGSPTGAQRAVQAEDIASRTAMEWRQGELVEAPQRTPWADRTWG